MAPYDPSGVSSSVRARNGPYLVAAMIVFALAFAVVGTLITRDVVKRTRPHRPTGENPEVSAEAQPAASQSSPVSAGSGPGVPAETPGAASQPGD